jgi:pimeloyl-ACP methyl ester carboxylesterase
MCPVCTRGVDFRNTRLITREFLEAFGVGKTAIMADSMGGYFALTFALAYRERVDKLILIGSPPMINVAAPRRRLSHDGGGGYSSLQDELQHQERARFD